MTYYDINTFLESVSDNIAIIDIMLGKDNGIDIFTKIPNIKLYFISGKTFSRRLFRQSFIFLVKPISNEQLKQALSSLLHRLFIQSSAAELRLNLNDVSYFDF